MIINSISKRLCLHIQNISTYIHIIFHLAALCFFPLLAGMTWHAPDVRLSTPSTATSSSARSASTWRQPVDRNTKCRLYTTTPQQLRLRTSCEFGTTTTLRSTVITHKSSAALQNSPPPQRTSTRCLATIELLCFVTQLPPHFCYCSRCFDCAALLT